MVLFWAAIHLVSLSKFPPHAHEQVISSEISLVCLPKIQHCCFLFSIFVPSILFVIFLPTVLFVVVVVVGDCN